ncbi:MAG: restriction endonuclease [Proteobacteria bacterium]|nr:restriction endonuclease [Pseudomonadota bacterium]MBU1686422.1 restriction endonuclease [Pseudomonadota bacterium]
MLKKDILSRIDLPIFIEITRVFFDQMGFMIKPTGTGSGPGLSEVEILFHKLNKTPFALCQCHVAPPPVTVDVLDRYRSMIESVKLSSGYLITTGELSEEVRARGVGKNITMLDGKEFVDLVNKMPQAKLSLIIDTIRATVTGSFRRLAIKEMNPDCPKCGAPMGLQVTEGKHRKGKFWECPDSSCNYIKAWVD